VQKRALIRIYNIIIVVLFSITITLHVSIVGSLAGRAHASYLTILSHRYYTKFEDGDASILRTHNYHRSEHFKTFRRNVREIIPLIALRMFALIAAILISLMTRFRLTCRWKGITPVAKIKLFYRENISAVDCNFFPVSYLNFSPALYLSSMKIAVKFYQILLVSKDYVNINVIVYKGIHSGLISGRYLFSNFTILYTLKYLTNQGREVRIFLLALLFSSPPWELNFSNAFFVHQKFHFLQFFYHGR
jgi:hypothetical protein